MKNVEQSMQILKELRKMGVGIALDDFGQGHTSLTYLARLPITSLKIDKSFVRDLPASPEDSTITKAIISLGHNLGFGVTAEGVEREEQLEFLQQNNCEQVQGYYFSPALPVDELIGRYDSVDIG